MLLTATVMTVGLISAAPQEQHLVRPDGSVAFEVHGDTGPWVVCVPGMGDLRAQFRFLVEPLRALGYRVVLMDLRGMGGSTAAFANYSAAAVGEDVVALLDQLNTTGVTVMGNSFAAAAAVWAAAQRPERVSRLILLGPFVRDVPAPFYQPLMLSVLFGGPWGKTAWMMYYTSLYRSRPPLDFSDYKANLANNLAQPGRMDALRAMLASKKAPAYARISEVRAKVLVVMGTQDPDFSDPHGEATLVAGLLHGQARMVEGAGHYLHAEFPQETLQHVVTFLQGDRP